jgi:hypothetical protein
MPEGELVPAGIKIESDDGSVEAPGEKVLLEQIGPGQRGDVYGETEGAPLIGEESGECFALGVAGGGEEFDGEGAAGFFAEPGGGVFEPTGGIENRGGLEGIVFDRWRGFAEPDVGLENAVMQTACAVEELVDEKGAIGAEGESLANALVFEDGGSEVPNDEETAFRGRGVEDEGRFFFEGG